MAATAYPNPAPAPAKLPKAGFFWALGIFVVTAAVGITLIVLGARQFVDDVDGSRSISAPGQSDVQLEEGDAWVFASVPSGDAADLVTVRITDPNGATQTLSQETIPTNSASTDGEQFVPLGFFSVDTAGTYTFDIDSPEGTDVRVGTLSIGKLLGFIFGGMAIGGIGFTIALILLIVTLVRRGGAKKRRRAAAYAAGGGGGYPGGGYAAPGAYPAQPQPAQAWPPAGQAPPPQAPGQGQWPPPTAPQQWPPQDPGAGAPPPPPPTS